MYYETSQNKHTNFVSVNSLIQTKKYNGLSVLPPSAVTVQAKTAIENPEHTTPIQKQANHTDLPDNLKTGVENLSGFSMNDVQVHYNSSKPAQLQALAYTQGTDIHIAPGQERHLPHEAWHVVQQKQGRVQPTFQMKKLGVEVNDDPGLEQEAEVMGSKATCQFMNNTTISKTETLSKFNTTMQCRVDYSDQVSKFNGSAKQITDSAEIERAVTAIYKEKGGPKPEAFNAEWKYKRDDKDNYIVGHGNGTTLDGYTPQSFTTKLIEHEIRPMNQITLVSCDTGTLGGFANQVADNLKSRGPLSGTKISAPDSPIFVNSRGSFMIVKPTEKSKKRVQCTIC